MAEKLKYDMTRVDVLMPKNLKTVHNYAAENYRVQKDKMMFDKYKARYKKLQKFYEYSNGTYQIVIPLGLEDIIEEGKILKHCVGGYAERHVKGVTTILFMRKCSDSEERLVTIEINDKTKHIRQNYGFKDRLVTKEEQVFIDEWLIFVKAGGNKKKKDKKTVEEAA